MEGTDKNLPLQAHVEDWTLYYFSKHSFFLTALPCKYLQRNSTTHRPGFPPPHLPALPSLLCFSFLSFSLSLPFFSQLEQFGSVHLHSCGPAPRAARAGLAPCTGDAQGLHSGRGGQESESNVLGGLLCHQLNTCAGKTKAL